MSDRFIISVVVLVALIAHIWIFKWVKFKIDESTIINFIKQHTSNTICSSDEISSNTDIKLARVAKVCVKSKAIIPSHQGVDYWTIP